MKTPETSLTNSAIELQEIISFQNFILRFYQKHGRHELPWRKTNNPYNILVSELMLQQTQVARVIPKYVAFLERFPTVDSLATAQLSEVLSLWQGLGYNRRAKFLWQLATELVTKKSAITSADSSPPEQALEPNLFPHTEAELTKLPGIGPYTASAIVSFAYNKPTVVIETNVRTVFLYHFFPEQTAIPDSKILPIIQQTVFEQNPQEWYWALMDYGAYLKKVLPNPSRKSKHHTKQSKFQGSLRQVRGEIIRILIETQNNHVKQNSQSENIGLGLLKQELKNKITSNKIYFEDALQQLLEEKLVVENNNTLQLP